MTYTRHSNNKLFNANQLECYYSQKRTAQMRSYFRDQLEAYYARIEHIDPTKMVGC